MEDIRKGPITGKLKFFCFTVGFGNHGCTFQNANTEQILQVIRSTDLIHMQKKKKKEPESRQCSQRIKRKGR
jgi:hypothetical protein